MPYIDEFVIGMVTTEGFDEKFYQTWQETGLHQKDCFDILNKLYEKSFGHKRYANFESYRISRNRRLNRDK